MGGGPGVLGLDAEGEELLFGDPGHLVVALRGEDEPVVAEEGGRVAPALGRLWKRTTSLALTTFMARDATHSLEWSSIMLSTS